MVGNLFDAALHYEGAIMGPIAKRRDRLSSARAAVKLAKTFRKKIAALDAQIAAEAEKGKTL